MTDADITDLLLEARHSTAHRLLAQRIVSTADRSEIEALVAALSNEVSLIRNNAAKVLGEVASSAPALLKAHVAEIATAVEHGSGVVVWEGMTVLSEIATIQPDLIAPYISTVQKAMTGPSVIARDRGVRILVELSRNSSRRAEMMSLLVETVRTCPLNQLPSYAEQISEIAGGDPTGNMRSVLEARLVDLPAGAKYRRVAAVLKKLG